MAQLKVSAFLNANKSENTFKLNLLADYLDFMHPGLLLHSVIKYFPAAPGAAENDAVDGRPAGGCRPQKRRWRWTLPGVGGTQELLSK